MHSRDLTKMILNEGWELVRVKGHQYKHPTKSGTVTIPHPKTDLPKGTVKSILKQAGIE